MSKKATLWTVIVIVILIIIGWVWYSNSSSSAVSSSLQNGAYGQGSANDTTGVSAASATSVPDPNAGLTTSPTNSSDAALQQDMTSVNGQMNGLTSDNSNVDQSVNSSGSSASGY